MNLPTFYLANFAWNYALGVAFIAVPLHANAIGLSATEIGTLLSAPVVGQIVLSLVSGALVDRLGGRRILLAACAAMLAAGAVLALADGFWGLVFGQCLIVLSRSAFWPSSWMLASTLPDPAKVFGRFNLVVNIGQIIGTASCGFMLAAVGSTGTFAAFAVFAGIALASAARQPEIARRRGGLGAVMKGYRELLGLRVVYFAMFSSFLGALPLALSLSFYPIYFASAGLDSGTAGIVVAARGLGAALGGVAVARWIRPAANSLWTPLWALVSAVGAGLLPLAESVVACAMVVFVAGIASTAIMIYSQTVVTQETRLEQRGLASALNSQGWVLALLVVPLVMGTVTDHYDIRAAFYVIGGFFLLLAVVAPAFNAWACRGSRTRPA